MGPCNYKITVNGKELTLNEHELKGYLLKEGLTKFSKELSLEKPRVTVSTPIIKNIKLKENAESLRSNEGQVQPTGDELRRSPEQSSSDIQRNEEIPSGYGETKQQAGIGAKEEGHGEGKKEELDKYRLPFIEEASDKRTGIKNAISYKERYERTLPKVEVPKLGKDVEVVAKGKELVDSGKINPREVVKRINSTNEGMHPDEASAMQYYMHQLSTHEINLKEQLAHTEEPVLKAELNGQLQQLSDEIDAATEANIKSGKAWSDVGNIRQIVTDIGFNPSREKAIIKDAYGGKIPIEVQQRLDKITKERDAAVDARLKAEERLKNLAAQKTLENIKKRAEKTAKTDQTKEALKKEEQELLKELKKSLRKDLGNLNAGIPVPKETLETLGKLAVNYFKQGAVTVESLVSKIYEQIKDDVEGVTRKDVRDFLAEYEPLVKEKEITRLHKKATGIEEKLTPPIIKTEKGELRGVNEPVSFKSEPKVKLLFKTDTEWVKANQRVINAEYKLKQEKRKAFESEKNFYQKGLMWAGRVIRLSILSGYGVLGKLASAATIGSALKRIPEQTIGSIYSGIFKGVAEKAPIEGTPNISAELKFYKEFFNPKKFAQNSWEILKSGASPLTKRLSAAEYEHVPILYLPTDLHQIIKDPVKRATFEASFKNAINWADRNGLDIHDPLVVQSMENAAYKRANYEIFQEQNWLSKKFSGFKGELEKKGNVGNTLKFLVDFMIPVSTVPTNIVRRLTTTSPLGLIRGSAQLINAYRKGIENLKPEEADAVMRQLKQGSLGTALWLAGWFGASNFGGLYSKYNPNKKRKEGDFVSDEMSIGGKMIYKPVQHALPLEIIQLAATTRRIYDNYRDNKEASTFESVYNAGLGSIGALSEQIPVIETGAHLIGAFNEPYEAKKLKEDVKRRFEPQILRETGIISKDETKTEKSTSGGKKFTKSTKKYTKKQ